MKLIDNYLLIIVKSKIIKKQNNCISKKKDLV